jgi:predicted RNase H-like HicB family nuclease
MEVTDGLVSSPDTEENLPMKMDVFLTPTANNGYMAQVLAWPEMKLEATTREQALGLARTTIMQHLAQGEVVKVEIKPEELEHPWLKFAGTWADDPTFDDFVAEMERYRRELDAEYEAELEAEVQPV